MKGLVLAGGGAKGSYQVGVYDALMELGWRPELITGTSVGCLNGALFALDKAELARDMWLNLTNDQVMAPPEEHFGGELGSFLSAVVRDGGLDVAPLEKTIQLALDENALRNGKIGYGLVTVNRRTLRSHEMTLDEIPQGQLADYMLASAACYPAFKPRTINGEEFIDGGYRDNMPYALAARMGATELVVVDVDGIGVTRLNTTKLPTRTIRSGWDLGSILDFNPETARRNIQLGYQDCYRSFGRVLGALYAILPDETLALKNGFVAPYVQRMKRLLERHPSLAIAEHTALLFMDNIFTKDDENTPLAPLERACKHVGVDPIGFYTAEQLFCAFLKKADLAQCASYAPLWGESEASVIDIARAVAQPNDFLTAVVASVLLEAKGTPLLATASAEPEPVGLPESKPEPPDPNACAEA